MLNPIRNLTRGFHAYLKGASWLKSHPKSLILVFLPMVLGLGAFVLGWNLFFGYEDLIMEWALFAKPESWWGIGLYYTAKVFLYIASLLLGFVASILVVNIIASPIYEYISMIVEADLTGKPAPELSIVDSLKLIGEEIKKVLFILLISLALLFVPGLNVLATLVTATLIGWDFYDYSLARRGWTFRERTAFMLKDGWAVMGFGLWLVIPFIQFVLMPLAIAGGTMLSVEALQKNNLLDKDRSHASK